MSSAPPLPNDPPRWRTAALGRVGRGLGRAALFAVAFAAAGRFIACPFAGREGSRWFTGEPALGRAAASGVAAWLARQPRADQYATGSARFDGEWLFGTYMMAGMGFGQLALAHPEERARLLPELDRVLEALASPAAQRFDGDAWHELPLATLEGDRGHAAFLGYLGLVLGLHRLLEPNSRFAPLHDRLVTALERRLDATPSLLLETYPGELYPVDNASVIGTLALHARATGRPRPALVARWVERARTRFIEPRSGLLHQAWDGATDLPADAPRGSGTALAAYFLAYADVPLSHALSAAVERSLARPILGFGLVREYPRGWSGSGDIDSGPLVLGYSISASGFALAGRRMYGDAGSFSRLYATFHLLGAPLDTGEGRTFVSGGPLADAIMLAMLTAPRGGAS